ncbi:MAG: response regulator [Methanomicrobiales archaeon]|nr:response regulator [Methanomicrobiales archaeon]
MTARRILIVEDEAVTSVMLEKTLKELGYEVVGSAFDGMEAIELAKNKRPDLILMDIRIQGDMDGIETAKEIYKNYNIPSIYLTAHSDENTIKRAVESGPFGYLIKPFKERELYSNIEMVAHKHKLYKTTTRTEPEEPEREPEKRQQPPAQAYQSGRPPDLRLGILAVQALPHPVILLTTNGTIAFTNAAFRSFFKLVTGQTDAVATTIDDLPELYNKIWMSGRDRFKDGKRFSINGPIQVKGNSHRFRIDMLPIMEKGTLHFIASIILPSETGPGIGIPDTSGNLLEEAITTIKEIRFLASSEETFRLHQIVTRADEVLKALGEIRNISYPGQVEKKRD